MRISDLNKTSRSKPVLESKVKELADDLKNMDNGNFKKKYGKDKEQMKSTSSSQPAKKPVQEAHLEEDDLIIIPGQGHRLKSGFIPHGQSRLDHEVEMARSDLYSAAKNAKTIHSLIKDLNEEQGLEGWVQEKIIKANDYLNSVREYLEGKKMHEMQGGVIAGGGVGESNDYFRRREREEDIISGKRPARKRAPAQTSDYAKRREQEKKQDVSEGSTLSDVSLVYISTDRAKAFEDWMESEGLTTDVPKRNKGKYIVYDYSKQDHTSKMYADEWNEKKQGVSEASPETTFNRLKGLKSWQVVIKNNYYNGKYPDYQGREYTVLATGPEEAKQVVLDNADAILQDLLSKKYHSGKKILPRGSALPVTEKHIGQIKDGAGAGGLKMTTLGFKKLFGPQGPMMVKLTDGEVVDIQGQEQGVAEGKEEDNYSDEFVQSQIDYNTQHSLSGNASDRLRINGSLNYYRHIKNKRIKDGTWSLTSGNMKEGAKVDRMVKHIAKSERKLGKSKDEAEDIAWATANKRGYLDNKNKKGK